MALTGKLTGSYSGSPWRYVPYLRFSAIQSVAENRSELTVTFGITYAGGSGSESYNNYPHTASVTVDGTRHDRSVTFDFRGKSAGDYDLASVSGIVLAHGADGTRSVTLSASHATGVSMGTGTVSGTVTLDAIPVTPAPSVPAEAVTVTDDDASRFAVWGHVQNVSRLRVETDTSLVTGEVSSVSVSVGSRRYAGDDVTTDVITSSGAVPVTVTVTDRYGRTASRTKTVTVTPYTPPAIASFAVRRTGAGDGNVTGACVDFACSWNDMDGTGTLRYAVQMRAAGQSDFTTVLTGTAQTAPVSQTGLLLTGVTVSRSAACDFRLSVSDGVSAAPVVAAASLSPEPVIFDVTSSGTGAAFFRTARRTGLEIAGPLFLEDGSCVNALTSDTVQTAYGDLSLYAANRVAFLRLNALQSLPDGTVMSLGTVPASFCPAWPVSVLLFDLDGQPLRVDLSANGLLSAYFYGPGTMKTVAQTVTYLTV